MGDRYHHIAYGPHALARQHRAGSNVVYGDVAAQPDSGPDELGEREDDQSDDETTCVEMEVVEYRRGDDESDGRRDQVDDGADEKTDHALIVGLCRR